VTSLKSPPSSHRYSLARRRIVRSQSLLSAFFDFIYGLVSSLHWPSRAISSLIVHHWQRENSMQLISISAMLRDRQQTCYIMILHKSDQHEAFHTYYHVEPTKPGQSVEKSLVAQVLMRVGSLIRTPCRRTNRRRFNAPSLVYVCLLTKVGTTAHDHSRPFVTSRV